jgi:hypothetical protein
MRSLFKKHKALTIAILGSLIIALCWAKYSAKTAEDYADEYTKKWSAMINNRETVAFDLKHPNGQPLELTNQWGKYLVKVKEARPYLDGYKITFAVANQSALSFPKPKVKLSWSYLRPEYDPQDCMNVPDDYVIEFNKKWKKELDAWSASFKEKRFTNLPDLKGNSWTELEFIVMPCTEHEFEHVEFSITG